MKHLSFAIAAAIALVPAGAAAQYLTEKSYEFVDAVKKGDGNKVTDMLNANPRGLVNSKDIVGNTGLIYAVQQRDDTFTAYLLNHGADPNLAGKDGNTPLIIAARLGWDTAVEWLLSTGAKVDTTNRAGETALIAAVQQRSVPVVKLLLNAGADPDRTDSVQGFSARAYAKRDPRARDVLALIEAKAKPAKVEKVEKIDDFKLE